MKNPTVETIKDQTQVQVELRHYSSGAANCLFEGERGLATHLTPEKSLDHLPLKKEMSPFFYHQ